MERRQVPKLRPYWDVAPVRDRLKHRRLELPSRVASPRGIVGAGLCPGPLAGPSALQETMDNDRLLSSNLMVLPHKMGLMEHRADTWKPVLISLIN